MFTIMVQLSALLLLLLTVTTANEHDHHDHYEEADHHDQGEMLDHHDHGEMLEHHEREQEPGCMVVEEKITTCKMEPMDMEIWQGGKRANSL